MLFVISAPSGAGKTTIIRELFKSLPNLVFSVSATTREKRENETEGKDYYFLSENEFEQKVLNNEFAEYEEVHGKMYGTLRSEIEKYTHSNKHLIFDIEVKGALSIKKLYPDAVLRFIDVPVEELLKRLRKRNTETQEQIEKRASRIRMEVDMKEKFDYVIDNSKGLDDAVSSTKRIIEKYNK
jgi:guanylate kinase